LAALAVLALAGCGTVLHGRVFVDRDGDRVRDPDEPGVPGVRVFFEATSRARTDDAGDFWLVSTYEYGIAWAWTPDGFRPGPSFAYVRDPDGGTAIDIPLAPSAAPTPPWTFAVGSDSHVVIPTPDDRWDGGDLAGALVQLTAPAPTAPVFYTLLGDLTQGGKPAQVDAVEAARSGIAVPFVPVSGNHDFYDEVPTWRLTHGPDVYGFDVGGVRVVVWNGFVDDAIQRAYLRVALGGEDPGATIIGMGHASPRDAVARDMGALGVDYLFTGHWHANRRIERFGLVEWGTESIGMGGLDHGPAGYRVVTVESGGRLSTVSRRTLAAPVVALAAPAPGGCAPGGGRVQVIAIAALDAGTPSVTAAWADAPGSRVDLAPAGGWTFSGAVPPIGRASRAMTITATTPSGTRRSITTEIAACLHGPRAPPSSGSWPQVQGGPSHTGAAQATAHGLAAAWTSTVGGHVLAGPIVAGDQVFVTVTDLADGDRGGVVALSLATGRERWRYVTPYPVRASAAVATAADVAGATPSSGGSPVIDPSRSDGFAVAGARAIVVAADSGGTVHALDAATGTRVWKRDLAAGTDSWSWHLWQPPTIVDGAVVIGTQPTLVALELATGAPRWTKTFDRPWAWLGATAAATPVGDGILFVAGRYDGLWVGDRATGAERVAVMSEDYVAIAGSPVATPERTFVASSYGTVLAIDPATLGQWWKTPLVPNAHAWSDAIVGNLAVAGGRVFAPVQTGELVALDAATGAVLWRAPSGSGPLTVAAYAGDGAGAPASPVVTGDVVWLGGLDGTLRAFDVATGRVREDHGLGSPILAPIAPAGTSVIAATFGGTVHLLAPPAKPAAPFPWVVFPLGLVVIAIAAFTLRLRGDSRSR
jgi:outer membrane protein assembly factor BamB